MAVRYKRSIRFTLFLVLCVWCRNSEAVVDVALPVQGRSESRQDYPIIKGRGRRIRQLVETLPLPDQRHRRAPKSKYRLLLWVQRGLA